MSDRQVTENPQEFLMRTLSRDQWRVVAECLRTEVDAARAAERERIAQEIEGELVCGCEGNDTHGGGICHWGAAAARIARADREES